MALVLNRRRHPVCYIPPELLVKIFINCLPCDPCPNGDEAPLNISSVCSTWRQIAISTQQLWSHIFITDRPNCHYISIVETWISRSLNYGFSFTLRWCPVNPQYEKKVRQMIDLLVEHCGTWREVAFTLPMSYASPLMSVIPTETPILEKLAVHSAGHMSLAVYSIDEFFSNSLPSLTHMSFQAHTTFAPHNCPLRLENLCSLSLLMADPFTVMDILSRSPRLEDATIHVDYGKESFPGSRLPKEHVSLACLHFLRLAATLGQLDADGGGLGEFLEKLHLPVVKTLFLGYKSTRCDRNENNTFPWKQFVDLLCRSNSNLQNLEILGIGDCGVVGPSLIPGFLAAVPDLKYLGVSGSPFSSSAIYTLIQHLSLPSNRCLRFTPSLESFSILSFFSPDETRGSRLLNTIVDQLECWTPLDIRPPLLILGHRLFESYSLPSESRVEIITYDNWKAQHKHDLFKDTWGAQSL
ncbi:hypothetical protein BD410DRAFT_546305 [Rickenella mellea]|uniref:F-box domain-containing protein n=1 Tax=Rickenella mellea TaxID=50990 RepID=A0A4Y7PQ24_9AGAM|nr:hypothetical protein BD410DRAFT_546305 [Rickenella mellea]